MATSARPDMPDNPGLWHSADPGREAASAGAAEAPGCAVTEAPAEATEPVPPGEPVSGSGAQKAVALKSHEPAPEREQAEEPAVGTPGPEPEESPPPPGEAPGWYPDPAQDGLRRFWDGHAWTGHVWPGRTRERTRKARGRR